jgi:hypothetical protein
MARLRELGALGNAASRLYREVLELSLAGEVERLTRMASPDLVYVDHRPLVGGVRHEGFEEVYRWTQTLTGFGFGLAAQDTIATRGERLAVIRIVRRTDAAEIEAIVLVELDEDGRGRALELFEVDQLDEAIAILDQRYAEHVGPSEAWDLLAEGMVAINRRDVAGLEALMAPELVAVDHRAPGWGRLDKDELVGRFPPVFEQRPHARWTIERDVLRGEEVIVCQLALRGQDTGFENQMLCLAVGVEGAMRRIETFPVDDEPAALARAGELGIAGRALGNRCSVAFRRYMAALGKGDLELALSLISEDARVTDHRAIVGGSEAVGVDEAVPAFVQAFMAVGFLGSRSHIVATRGERLALVQWTLRAGGADIEMLILACTDDDGLGHSNDLFDPDQLDAALALLDAMFAEQLASDGLPANLATESWRRSVDAVMAGDSAALRTFIRPDMVMVDHRPLGTESAAGQDEVVRWTETSAVVGFERAETRAMAVRGQRLALSLHTRWAGAAVVETLRVNETDQQGRGLRTDTFDPSQLDEALALLDQRYAEELGPELAAIAAFQADGLRELNIGDHAAIRRRMPADARLRDHRLAHFGTMTREEWLASYAPVFERATELRFWVSDLIAVGPRGTFARLEMATVIEGGETSNPFLAVTEIVDGALLGFDLYPLDDVVAARARWVELSGGPLPSQARFAFGRAIELLNERDLDGFASLLAEDFLGTDHRPLGWANLGKADFLAWYPPMLEQRPDVRWAIREELLATDRVICLDVSVGGGAAGDEDEPGIFEVAQTVVVTAAEDGLATSFEIFDQAERDVALALARRLAVELEGSAPQP